MLTGSKRAKGLAGSAEVRPASSKVAFQNKTKTEPKKRNSNKLHCSPDNARRQAQLRPSSCPPLPCPPSPVLCSPQSTSRGIINTLETRVSSIGGCNNKRSGRPPMWEAGVEGARGRGVRANEGMTAVQTQSCTNKLRDKEQRSRSRTGRVWSVAWFPLHTHAHAAYA